MKVIKIYNYRKREKENERVSNYIEQISANKLVLFTPSTDFQAKNTDNRDRKIRLLNGKIAQKYLNIPHLQNLINTYIQCK